MNLLVLHASPRKGNTDAILALVKEHLSSRAPMTFHDVYLPKDAPVFCRGCYACFEKGEQACPNAGFIQPIAERMMAADGIIIAAPVYVMQIPGSLKALLDHFAYRYLNHRPAYFGKKAFIISNTAGAGKKNALKYLKQNLTFWGIHDITTLGLTLQAMSLDEMKPERKNHAIKLIHQKSEAYYQSLKKGSSQSRPSFLGVIMFHMGRSLMNSLPETNADKQYWQQKGWLSSERQFYEANEKPCWYHTLCGKIATHFAFK